MSYLKIEKKRFTGIASFLVIGTLLLAACGPEATPTTTSTTTTIVPGTGSTPTNVTGVITTPTISTESPPGVTPEATETTGTSMEETPSASMGETPESMTTPGTMTGVGASYVVTMTAQNNSGQDGAAVVTDLGNGMVNVVLDITSPGTNPQPAHIHQGTCAQLDPQPAYPLSNVVNGKSVTEIEADFDTLTATPFAINVHKSAAEASVYVSCGDITTEGMTMLNGTPGATMGETPGATMEETPGASAIETTTP